MSGLCGACGMSYDCRKPGRFLTFQNGDATNVPRPCGLLGFQCAWRRTRHNDRGAEVDHESGLMEQFWVESRVCLNKVAEASAKLISVDNEGVCN